MDLASPVPISIQAKDLLPPLVQIPSSYPDVADRSIQPICHSGWMAQSTEKANSPELIAAPAIEKRIFVVRGRQVMLDEDLADLYGVETRRLIEQVKRNRGRFPEDFMFQLSKEEAAVLRSQIAISTVGRAVAATRHTSLPSREWRCSRGF
jgi:hypothetical protein